MSPLIVILLAPWYLAYKDANNKTTKWKYSIIGLISTIIHLPIYFFAIDYGRWEYSYFFNSFILIVLFVYLNDVGITNALLKILNWAKKNIIILLCVFVYLNAIPASSAWYIPEIHKLADLLIKSF